MASKGAQVFKPPAGANETVYKWSSGQPMPTKRVFATALPVGDHLFVLGGCDARGVPVDNFESCKDVPVVAKKKLWDRLLNMPTPRAGVCAVAIGDKLLTFGGVNVNQEPVDVVEIYDCKKKKWVEGVDTMKERLLGLSAVVKDNKAIVAGGMGFDTNPKDYLMAYLPDKNKWESMAPMPTPRYATFSLLIDERLYVLGGRQGKVPITAAEAYDFREGKWQELPNIPTKRVFSFFCHDGEHLFNIGGLNEDAKQGFSDTTEIFDITKGEWRTGQHMIDKRGDFAAGILNGKIITAGGLTNDGKPLSRSEMYDVSSDTWTALPEMATSHCSCAHTVYKDYLCVIGGLTIGGPSNTVDCFSDH